jgi:Trypsin-like peptidase domain
MNEPERILEFGPPEISGPEGPGARALRRVVLPILVIQHDGHMNAIGTCFVVSGTGRDAIALTAKHNIDYVMQIDGSRDIHAPTTPPEFRVVEFQRRWKNLTAFVALWVPDDQIIPCDLVQAWFVETGHDLAAVLLKIPDRHNATFTKRLRIDSRGPRVGDQVRAAGYPGVVLVNPREDEDGVIVQQSFNLPLTFVEATVTRSYDAGEQRFVKGPCVELDCELEHGMSGGPIFTVDDLGAVIACAMVTSGTSWAQEGIGSLLYPALSLGVSAEPVLGIGETPALVDAQRVGLISDVAEAYRHLKPDGLWCTEALPVVEFYDLRKLPVGDYVTADTTETPERRAVEYLSSECVRLGRINQYNGDDAEFFLISKEICDVLRNRVDPHGVATDTIRFLKSEKPYIWFLVGAQPYRLFVFAVEGNGPPVKILTDAHRVDGAEEDEGTKAS